MGHEVRSRVLVFLLLALPFWTAKSATAQNPDTFVIKIALRMPTIHVGDVLVIEETLSNPTDHVVVAGNGTGVGSMVECLNAKGEDLGRQVVGSSSFEDPVRTFHTPKIPLPPRYESTLTWHYTPDAGSLIPGTYRVRTHIRDMNSGADVYSNTVVLTVLP
jgi:hypothetical protein